MRAVIRTFGLLALILAGISATAQNAHEIQVDVPFTFTAAGRELPAGEYHLYFNPYNSIVVLRGDNSTSLFLMSAPSNPTHDERSFLRFYSNGEYRTLQDISITGAVRRLASSQANRGVSLQPGQPGEKTLGAVATPSVITLRPDGEKN